MKKRQLRKAFKIVSKKLNRGDFTKLTPVHYRIVKTALGQYIDKKYITEFRPWWYSDEIFGRWGELNITIEHVKFFDKAVLEFEKWSGINMDLWKQYIQLNRK